MSDMPTRFPTTDWHPFDEKTPRGHRLIFFADFGPTWDGEDREKMDYGHICWGAEKNHT